MVVARGFGFASVSRNRSPAIRGSVGSMSQRSYVTGLAAKQPYQWHYVVKCPCCVARAKRPGKCRNAAREFEPLISTPRIASILGLSGSTRAGGLAEWPNYKTNPFLFLCVWPPCREPPPHSGGQPRPDQTDRASLFSNAERSNPVVFTHVPANPLIHSIRWRCSTLKVESGRSAGFHAGAGQSLDPFDLMALLDAEGREWSIRWLSRWARPIP